MSSFETFIIWAIIFSLGLFSGYAIGQAKADNNWIEYIREVYGNMEARK